MWALANKRLKHSCYFKYKLGGNEGLPRGDFAQPVDH